MTDRNSRGLVLRSYDPRDAAATLAVFTEAITQTAAAYYTPEQIEAWAQPGRRDPRTWNEAMCRRASVVAVSGNEVVGFSDVDANGYIDMLFVSPRHLRRGVAGTLLAFIEHRALAAGTPVLTSDVSIAARPFFESIGFTVVREQRPLKEGVALTNYRMTKSIAPAREVGR